MPHGQGIREGRQGEGDRPVPGDRQRLGRRPRDGRAVAQLHTGLGAGRPRPAPQPVEGAKAPAEGAPGEVEGLRARVAELEYELAMMRGVVEIVKKDPGVDRRSLTNREKTLLIDAARPTYSLSFLASDLGIPLSSYHYCRRTAARPDKLAAARAALREEFEAARGARGYRYLARRLRERMGGSAPGERAVRRLMAEEGLRVVYAKRPRRAYSSYLGEVSEAPPNLVGRGFSADAPNRLWLTDITEFSLPGEGRKVYLSPVLDCFGGALASWSIGTRPTADLANKSLAAALSRLAPGERPVIHSDRGAHYRWPGWIALCEEGGLVRSMSAKGCSPDNAACEGFFGRLKNELFYHRDWSGVRAEEFMDRLDSWLVHHNETRPKESLGWMSPMQYWRSLGFAA